MTKWARVVGTDVVEVIDLDPTGRFHESIIWIPCADDVTQNWTYEDDEFIAPVEEIGLPEYLRGLSREEQLEIIEAEKALAANPEAYAALAPEIPEDAKLAQTPDTLPEGSVPGIKTDRSDLAL